MIGTVVRRYAQLFLAAVAVWSLGPGTSEAVDVPRDTVRPERILVRNATVWTQSEHGILEGADLLVRDGKIVRVGRDLKAPEDAFIIDGSGKHVTPGLIDCHSHTAIRGGVNEGSNNVTAEVRIKDVVDPNDINIYRQLAGGLTAAHLLHGSANSIGGQDAVIKLRWKGTREQLLMDGAPEGIKFALGENPKRSNFNSPSIPERTPSSRMGVHESIRTAFLAAREYENEWNEYDALSAAGRERREPPRRDLQLEAILEILNGKRRIHSHSYRQDEILALLRLAEEFGVRIGTFQHVLEGYKVADELASHGAGASTFSDWWAFKLEAYDAIPFNGALMHDRGVVVTFNSDSGELARRMNLEAAKAVKYGGVDEQAALSFVTLNAAIQLGIEDRVGSLVKGKDADFVIWSGHPLSVYSIVEQTWVDGAREFDRQADLELRGKVEAERAELVRQILAGDKDEAEPKGEAIAEDDKIIPENVRPHVEQETSTDEPAAIKIIPENVRPHVEQASSPDDPAAMKSAGTNSERKTPSPRPIVYTDRLAKLGGKVSIVGAIVHPITGPPIENGTVSFEGGKIVEVGPGLAPMPGARIVEAGGLHLYPGLIDANNVVGLTEIGSVAGSVDIAERGDVNPHVNTAIAINPDSELIPVTRANGLTHMLTVPGGGLVRGTSALMRLAGWTWEDLTASSPVAMHLSWPSFRIRTFSFFGDPPSRRDQEKRREESLEKIDELFDDARAYEKAKSAQGNGGEPLTIDPALEAMLPLLDGKIPLIVHASQVKQIESAVEWSEKQGVRIVIAGAGDIWRAADLLSEKEIPVILTSVLATPTHRDDPYDTPFTTATTLHEAGVRFCFAGSGSGFSASSARNLPYHAAMAVAFGLPRDEAVKALTLYPAQILGVDGALGSIEPGKSASLILVDGDPLEIRSRVEAAFIDGRETDLRDNKHERLFRRYQGRPRVDRNVPGS